MSTYVTKFLKNRFLMLPRNNIALNFYLTYFSCSSLKLVPVGRKSVVRKSEIVIRLSAPRSWLRTVVGPADGREWTPNIIVSCVRFIYLLYLFVRTYRETAINRKLYREVFVSRDFFLTDVICCDNIVDFRSF